MISILNVPILVKWNSAIHHVVCMTLAKWNLAALFMNLAKLNSPVLHFVGKFVCYAVTTVCETRHNHLTMFLLLVGVCLLQQLLEVSKLQNEENKSAVFTMNDNIG